MSIKQHINASRGITGVLEAINIIGCLVFVIAGLLSLTQAGLLGAFACGLAGCIWWFFNKLAYIGLQLLTDITELLHNTQGAN